MLFLFFEFLPGRVGASALRYLPCRRAFDPVLGRDVVGFLDGAGDAASGVALSAHDVDHLRRRALKADSNEGFAFFQDGLRELPACLIGCHGVTVTEVYKKQDPLSNLPIEHLFTAP